MWEIRILRNHSSGPRKLHESLQDSLRAATGKQRRIRVILAGGCYGREKLAAGGRGEEDLHRSVFRQERIGFCQDRFQVVSLSGCNLLIPMRQNAKKLPLVLGLLKRFRAHHHCRSTTTLCNEDAV